MTKYVWDHCSACQI